MEQMAPIQQCLTNTSTKRIRFRMNIGGEEGFSWPFVVIVQGKEHVPKLQFLNRKEGIRTRDNGFGS